MQISVDTLIEIDVNIVTESYFRTCSYEMEQNYQKPKYASKHIYP